MVRGDQPAPILKWAGGKRELLPSIMKKVPAFTGRYIEPFLGAGAVFFAMPASTKKLGNDFNPDLIELYRVVRDNPEGLLRELRKHKNQKEYFYEVRAWDRDPTFPDRPPVERAARLIFLNKTCFNGLYRVNSRNEFNVPFADLKNPDFIAEKNVVLMSSFLRASADTKSRATTLSHGDYRKVTSKATEGDFVYLDPPYDPLSETASFVSYHKDGFSRMNQEQLRDEIVRLTGLGVPVLLSNSNTPFICKLYSDKEIFRTARVSTSRKIGANPSSRGQTFEVLIDNYKSLAES